MRSLFPVVLALGAGAILLLALGRNPITFYGDVWQGGVSGGGWDAWQDSAIRMAPLLLIGTGLTVVFRANIWNLGYNGQFLLAAAVVIGYGPSLTNHLPLWFAMLLLFLMAGADRGRVDDPARGAEGALRNERDHHDADDVLHRRRPRQPADQRARSRIPR